ncbi:MAG: PHP domain-containing protein [Oscillospiraceae bacterium]
MYLNYDIHLHSCLSPCADNNMTPAAIAGFAKLAGIDVIAVTDHNTAENLPFVAEACKAYGIKMIPGIEVTTAEEIHVLCYFHSVNSALEMSKILYKSLPNIICNKKIYGEQIICNCDDENIGEVDKLLINATALSIYDIFELTKGFGGECVPAHIDRDSYSVLSVLGIMPEDLNPVAVELFNREKLQAFVNRGQIKPPKEVTTASDAHRLEDIATHVLKADEESFLWQFVKDL